MKNTGNLALLTLISITVLSLLSSFASAEVTVECSSPSWVSPAHMEGSILVAHQSGVCEIFGAPHFNVEKLYQAYQARMLKDVVKVHAPVTADSSLAALGVSADLEVTVKDGVIRNLVRLGTDSHTQFLYSSHSKEVRFSGFAKLVRKLDVDFTVKKTEDARVIISLTNLTWVKKPGIMPDFMFLAPGRGQAYKQFQNALNQLGEEIATELR